MKKTMFTPPNRAPKQSISLALIALAAIFAFTFIACDEGGDDSTANTDPKVLVIKGLDDVSLDDGIMVGIFEKNATVKEAIFNEKLVAGADSSENTVDLEIVKIEEDGSITAILFDLKVETPVPWKGNGAFDIYVMVGENFYTKKGVSFNSKKVTISGLEDITAQAADIIVQEEAIAEILGIINGGSGSLTGDLLKAAKLVNDSATDDDINTYIEALYYAYNEAVLNDGDNWDTLFSAALDNGSIDDLLDGFADEFNITDLDILTAQVTRWKGYLSAYDILLAAIDAKEATEDMFTAAGFTKLGEIADFEVFLEALADVIDGDYLDFYMAAYVANNTEVE